MKTLNDALSNMNDEERNKLVARISKSFREETDLRLDFYRSDVCNQIIESIKEGPHVLHSDDIDYDFKKTCKKFGWHRVSREQAHLFLTVMCSPGIDREAITNESTDSDCSFPNTTFHKRGLVVQIMAGQGTSISIGPIPK